MRYVYYYKQYHVVYTCCGVNLYCYSNGAELAVPTR